MSTEKCKAAIVANFGARQLKRKSKFNRCGHPVRIFSSDMGEFTVIQNGNEFNVYRGNLFVDPEKTLEEKMIEVAKKIRHCGDYGDLHWNPSTKEVFLILGDADGDPEYGGTSFEDIEEMFKAAGAKSVGIEAEDGPWGTGYKNLGRYGINRETGEPL